jgi:RNA polymerase sigma-70 factor (ECF subfamily)
MPDEPHRTVEPRRADAVGPFHAFVDPHLPVLWRVARSLCRNSYDAEDLVQDTLLRAFNGLDRFDGQHPRAWLLTIMRNAHINRHRRRRPGLLADGHGLTDTTDRRNRIEPSAEDVALSRATAPWITGAIARLSPRHLAVVQLVDIDGLTYDDAAAALGIPAGTVMSRLHRARHRMRTHLTRHPDDWSDHR